MPLSMASLTALENLCEAATGADAFEELALPIVGLQAFAVRTEKQ